MERLTERTADGILVKENYEKESLKTLYSCYGEKPNPHYSNCEEGYCAMEKLKDYEDLEEQGRLIKLPCKIGDIIYRVNAGAKEPVIKMIVLQVNYKQLREDRIIIRIDAMNDNDMGESCYLLEDFGKNVFLTESEAEAKLKELRGSGNESSN